MFIHSLHFFTPLYYILTFLTHLNTAELPGTRTIHHSDACDGPICRGVESVLNRFWWFWWAKWSKATFLIGFKPTTLNAVIHCKKVRSSGIHNVMAKRDMYAHHHPSISRAFPCACSVPGKWQNDRVLSHPETVTAAHFKWGQEKSELTTWSMGYIIYMYYLCVPLKIDAGYRRVVRINANSDDRMQNRHRAWFSLASPFRLIVITMQKQPESAKAFAFLKIYIKQKSAYCMWPVDITRWPGF